MTDELNISDLSTVDRVLLFYGVGLPNHPRKWWVHAWLRKKLRASPHGEFEVERHGLHWRLNPDDFEHESLFWLGGMDKWDIFHLKALLSPNCVFFDVGANFGYYSLIAAQTLSGNCRVVAFEPNPKTRKRLLWNIAANRMERTILVEPFALSDRIGTATLIERKDNSGASRLGTDAPGLAVGVNTIDSFCQERTIDRLDLIKIDVEGYEVKVLSGALTTLERFKPVLVVEFWPPGLSRAATDVDAIAKVLQDNGYTLYGAERKTLVPVVELPRGDAPVNLFAFHEQRNLNSFLRGS